MQPGSKGEHYKKEIRKRLRSATAEHDPVAFSNRIAAAYGLAYAKYAMDPPLKEIIHERAQRIVVRSQYTGAILHMERKPAKTTIVDNSAMLPVLNTVFPPPASYAELTDEERRARCEAFINLYSQTGLAIPAAAAVGVPYMQILLWVNKDPELVDLMDLANIAAKQVLEDAGRHMALRGDGKLVRYFLDRDNPPPNRGKKGESLPKQQSLDAFQAAMERARAGLPKVIEAKGAVKESTDDE